MKKRYAKKLMSATLASVMVMSMLSGCGSADSKSTEATEQTAEGHLSAFIICITIRYSVLRIIALERKRLARRSCPTCSFLFGNQKHA